MFKYPLVLITVDIPVLVVLIPIIVDEEVSAEVTVAIPGFL
jgi:hypothetical protein